MTEEKLSCFICQEYDECPYGDCYENEIAERVKQEEEAQIDMFINQEEER